MLAFRNLIGEYSSRSLVGGPEMIFPDCWGGFYSLQWAVILLVRALYDGSRKNDSDLLISMICWEDNICMGRKIVLI